LLARPLSGRRERLGERLRRGPCASGSTKSEPCDGLASVARGFSSGSPDGGSGSQRLGTPRRQRRRLNVEGACRFPRAREEADRGRG
jgi:hypothetical protein